MYPSNYKLYGADFIVLQDFALVFIFSIFLISILSDKCNL